MSLYTYCMYLICMCLLTSISIISIIYILYLLYILGYGDNLNAEETINRRMLLSMCSFSTSQSPIASR